MGSLCSSVEGISSIRTFSVFNTLKQVSSCYLCCRNSYMKTAKEKQNGTTSLNFMDLKLLLIQHNVSSQVTTGHTINKHKNSEKHDVITKFIY